jgi:hypothetical protein
LIRFTLTVFEILIASLLAAQTSGEPEGFLKKHAGFTQQDLSDLAGGNPAARILDPSVPTEVVPFGTVRVSAPAEFFVERFRDIATFKKGREVLQIGKFHSPPRLEDLDALTLGQDEIETLKRCRVGDCGLKMTAGMITRLQKEVNWTAPEWQRLAMITYRRILFDYVNSYLDKGSAALAVYPPGFSIPQAIPSRIERSSDQVSGWASAGQRALSLLVPGEVRIQTGGEHHACHDLPCHARQCDIICNRLHAGLCRPLLYRFARPGGIR